MLVPHDVFNDIIKHSDMKTLVQLCKTDQTIKQLCGPFGKVLLEFSNNPYFKPDVKSDLLNDFLNDLTGNDNDMLKRLQLSFGACLIGKNKLKQIIVLEGDSNGKSTFLTLLRKLLGYLFVNGSLELDTIYYDGAYLVNIIESNQNINVISRFKELSGGYMSYYKHDPIEHKFTIVYTHDGNIDSTDKVFNNRLNLFNFKTRYVNNPPHVNEKLRITRMIDILFSDPSTLPALLNFLLEGCREGL